MGSRPKPLPERLTPGCIFCTGAFTYDLSSLPAQTFVLHSGKPAVAQGDDKYVQYVATSPCMSVQSDMCFGGFSSSSIASPYPVVGSYPLAIASGKNGPDILSGTVCEELGSLNDIVAVTAFGKDGLSIALHSRSTTAIFNIMCDAEAPGNNPPESTLV